MDTDFDIIIVGGGLAGLVSAIELAAADIRVLLIEKKTYPYHKVCGEYVSNEVLEYLQSLGFDPFDYGASKITKLRISTPRGRNIYMPLDLGGFGLSRYKMDHQLYLLAQKKGAHVMTETRVTDIQFSNDRFEVSTNTNDIYTAKFVIGSYGKRETLDKKLKRPFIERRTGYMGIKYHIRTSYPIDEIGLDNFKDGYCGISKIEDDIYNLCNFYHRDKNYNYKSIHEFEEKVVFKNPVIKDIFSHSEFLFNEPVVINEICFDPKSQVEHHILMCGDSAGLITPLCGNGMSMAIGSARLLTGLIKKSHLIAHTTIPMQARMQLEQAYQIAWNQQFKSRLFWGRTIQGLFGNPVLTDVSLRAIHAIPALERRLMKATHGRPLV